MATTRNYQVKITVPHGAMPGMVLSVPVKNGSEKVQIRVPENCGVGSALALVQPEGSDEWDLQVLEAVIPEETEIKEVAAEENAPEEFRESRDPFPQLNIEALRPVMQLVRLETTVGPIDILLRHDWAPHGARRFIELVSGGDLSNLAFYRAIQGCIVQFGLPPKRSWAPIPDDPPTGVPFLQGAVSFASVGPGSRRATLFICVGDMSHCLGDKSWETPIGAVEESSLDVLDRIDTTYGDIVEFGGEGPDTSRIQAEGNAYLQKNFPRLSYVQSAMVLPDGPEGGQASDVNAPYVPLNGQTAEEITEAADQARASALEAANMASQAASVMDPDAMMVAVRRAREAANAAEAAAQAAEAAHAAARSRRSSSREVAPSTQLPVPVLSVQQSTPHAIPQGIQQGILPALPMNGPPDGRVQVPMPLTYAQPAHQPQQPLPQLQQPHLQHLQQPQQPQQLYHLQQPQMLQPQQPQMPQQPHMLQQPQMLQQQACLGGPAAPVNGMPHMPGRPHVQMDLT